MAEARDSEGWQWPAPADDGAARHLVAGLALPDIALAAVSGRTVSLAAVSGTLVVFFYPWAGRPGHPDPAGWDEIAGAHGSTAQLQAVATLHSAFVRLGVTVIGVSGQSTTEQAELVQRLGLPFDLASDWGQRLGDELRLPAFETGGVRYIRRLTLIAREGRIERVFYPVHPPHTHPREVLVAAAADAPAGRINV